MTFRFPIYVCLVYLFISGISIPLRTRDAPRLTHDDKYREWAWEAALAIQKHCKSEWCLFI
jgi:hypothetical protein